MQVVTLAVYSLLLASLMDRDYAVYENFDSTARVLELYFPVFTYLQALFYLGWLKVAESLFNPFGKDDDDFDVEGLLARNLRVSSNYTENLHGFYNYALVFNQSYFQGRSLYIACGAAVPPV